MPKRCTMKDVARLAGVSVQTVSCVVNDKPLVAEETRARVLAAIEQLGYRPFSVARSLRTRRTHTIAFLVSDIANPSFSAMASAAEDYAHSFGYSLVLYDTHDDVQREARYIRMATERWVDGVLFVSAQDCLNSLEALQAAGIPSVAIDRIPEGHTGPAVTLDNVAAGRLAAEHLLSLGHTRLAHIGGPPWLRLAREREQGFRQVLEEHGLALGSCVPAETWQCQSGYAAMRRIMAESPQTTAVFAANDRMAIGAMQAVREAGLRVPVDISVIGLDDIELAAFQSPPLTTIKQPFSRLATLAVQLLLDILAGKPCPETQVVLDPVLIVRQSTAASKGYRVD